MIRLWRRRKKPLWAHYVAVKSALGLRVWENGKELQDVRYWPRALSDAEVRELYK